MTSKEAKALIDAALEEFTAEFQRMEPGIPDEDFCRRMHAWLNAKGAKR